MILAGDAVFSRSAGAADPVMTGLHVDTVASMLGLALGAEWVEWSSQRGSR